MGNNIKIYGWWIITPLVTIVSFILMSIAFGVSKGLILIDPKNTLRRWWIVRPWKVDYVRTYAWLKAVRPYVRRDF
jgi:hypothetical protein